MTAEDVAPDLPVMPTLLGAVIRGSVNETDYREIENTHLVLVEEYEAQVWYDLGGGDTYLPETVTVFEILYPGIPGVNNKKEATNA